MLVETPVSVYNGTSASLMRANIKEEVIPVDPRKTSQGHFNKNAVFYNIRNDATPD